MRSTLLLLAGLAGSSLAGVIDRRNLGLVSDVTSVVGNIGSEVGSVVSSVLGGGQASTLLSGLSPQGAAALEAGALGAKAGSVSASARKELQTWLSSGASGLESFLTTSLLSWCEGSSGMVLTQDVLTALSVFVPMLSDLASENQLFVTIDGIFSAVDLQSVLVLSRSAQSELSAFLPGASGLDQNVLSGLNVCAAGGVVSSLTEEVKSTLFSWLSSSQCTLVSSLQTTVLSWLQGSAGGDVVQLGSLGGVSQEALSLLSVSSSIGNHVDNNGIPTTTGQALISVFLGNEICINIDATITAILQGFSKGQSASSFPPKARADLALWLTSSCNCALDIELQAILLFWLSFPAASSQGLSTSLISGLLFDVASLGEEVLSLATSEVRGALALLSAGNSLSVLSLDTRRQLVAFVAGATGHGISISTVTNLVEWVIGLLLPSSPASCPASSSTPSLPTSTPAGVTTTAPATTTPTGPASGPAPTTTPCMESTTAPAPTGAPTSKPVVTVTVTATKTYCPCE